jgi:hypothetical protein
MCIFRHYFTDNKKSPFPVIRNLFLVLVLLTGNKAIGRAQYKISLVEHTLSCIKAPLLHAFANVAHAWDNASSPGFALNEDQPKGMPVPYYGTNSENTRIRILRPRG